MKRIPSTDQVIMLGLFVFGTLLCLHYARQGLHPLDSSIVFDGAWRRMNGQQWMTDFSSPNGFTPIALQTLFFRVFGVNFLAYFLHAALFNGAFAVLVFLLLRRAGAGRMLAGAYAGLSAVVFYPPMGAPYMEQHGFFFLLLTVYLCVESAYRTGRGRIILLALLPSAMLLALLSKQIPGGFALPFALLLLPVFHFRKGGRELWTGLLLGLPLAFLAYALVMGAGGFHFQELWAATVELPGELGRERLAEWNFGPAKTMRSLAWLPFQILSPENVVNRWLLYIPLLAALGTALLAQVRGGKRLLRFEGLPLLLPAILMVLASSLFMKLTMNQMENGLPLVFVSLGLGHLVWLKSMEASGWRPWIRGAISFLLLGYHLWGGWHFNREVNDTRLVLDFPEEKLPAVAAELGCLHYRIPFVGPEQRPDELLEFLEANPGNFYLFGDLNWLYGMSGRPSIGPVLWMHRGLTLPPEGDPAMEAVDEKLLEQLESERPRWVILENTSEVTYMGVKLEEFPQSRAWIIGQRTDSKVVGGFQLWELGK